MTDQGRHGRIALRANAICRVLLGGWLALASLGLQAGNGDGCGSLEYRLKLRFREDAQPVEARFTLTPTAPLVTRNKVQKPRLGGWRLEGVQKEGAAVPMSMVLARAERLLYLSGPTDELMPTGVVVRFGPKPCRVWQVKASPNTRTYAYLVELRPDLLALSYLSASFAEGDLAAIEIQLERFQLDSRAMPAEEGQQLLRTLRRSPLAGGGAAPSQMVEVEQVSER